MEDFEEFQDYDEFQFFLVVNPQSGACVDLICYVTYFSHFDDINDYAMYKTLWMYWTSYCNKSTFPLFTLSNV